MSPVTPNPAAAFSTLAITKSMASRWTSAGIARRAISRPGFPKMSPTNRIRIDAAGSRRLSVRRPGCGSPDRAVRRRGAGRCAARRRRGSPWPRPASKAPPSLTARRSGRSCARRGETRPARDDSASAACTPETRTVPSRKVTADAGHVDAGKIHDDFDAGLGLEDVHRRDRPPAVRSPEANVPSSQPKRRRVST